MKRAVILHGTDGSPDINWFPWLKSKLEDESYEVWAPLLPDNHVPNWKTYNDFLLNGTWDFTDNIVVGHSSGAVEVLNLLMDERCPNIKLGVMVSAWAGGVPDHWEDVPQFDYLFHEDGFDFDVIKQKARHLAFMHGDNDIYCPISQAEYLAKHLDAPLSTVQGGGHVGNQFQELPQLWQILKPYL